MSFPVPRFEWAVVIPGEPYTGPKFFEREADARQLFEAQPIVLAWFATLYRREGDMFVPVENRKGKPTWQDILS
jgi:hypothetical protein